MSDLNEVSLPLSGLLTIQKNYLNDLAQISQNKRNVAGDLVDIQSRLNEISKSFDAANTSADHTLTHQSKMQEILSMERERLLSEKDKIDSIHYGKMRALELNDNYRKRQTEYIRIMIEVILGIALYIGCSFILPEAALTAVGILICSVVLIYSMNVLWRLYKRDNMDYDKLRFVPPEITPVVTDGITITSVTTASPSGAVCTGEVCCADGSRWDASMNKCIIACSDATKPISKGNVCIKQEDCSSTTHKICGNACILKTDACGGTAGVNTFSTLGDERIRTQRQPHTKPFTPYEYCDYSPAL